MYRTSSAARQRHSGRVGAVWVGRVPPPAGTTPGAYLINAAAGAILNSLPVGGSRVFSLPVLAQGTLFVATETKGLSNFAP